MAGSVDQTAILKEISEAPTLEEAAARLGAALGLAAPAPEIATRRTLADPHFAKALLALRHMPRERDRALAAPDTIRVRAAPSPGEKAAVPPPPSTAKLVKQSAGAVLKWGMAGLQHAQPWDIERRLAACSACPNQAPAPDTLVYRGAKVVAGKDAKICNLCHCLTNTKAALSTEHCPDRDPENPALSRWSEPWVPPEDHPAGPWR